MRNGEPGWLASLLGAAVLIAGGFALGLVAGVVSEEPELVVGHLVGHSDEVAWLPEGEPEFTGAGEAGALASDPVPEESRPAAAGLAAARPEEDEPPARRPEREAERATAPAAEAPLPAVAAPPPRAPAAPSPPPTSTASERPLEGFAVQVGAFSTSGAANRVRDKLQHKGFDAYVVSASTSGDGRWRVRVGPVPTRPAADALAGRLKSEERLPTWVLSEGGG